MKTWTKRVIAFILAVVMMISTAGCAKQPKVKTKQEALQSAVDLQQAQQSMEMTAPAEYDKNSMKDIAQMLGASEEDLKGLDKDGLYQMVEDLLDNQDKTPAKPDKSPDKDVEIDVGGQEDAYDEDGAMTKPFDQIYPEIVAEGAVEYDGETVLIKMSNSKNGEVTKAMSEAGVATLEAVVPMEKSTWYEAKLFPGSDVMIAVKMLRELKEIQMVDFNYLVEANGMAAAQNIPEEIIGTDKTDSQWHLKYCRYPQGYEVMNKKGGDPSVIVAVIDTGVDYDHEDLAQNIWKNTAEIPDNGIDDDNNGYIDDYYGVNIITGEGNGDDDHGHGTHVAGIIAAQNNNIGVVGMAYNVKVMPIKAGMASGYFNQSDIAKAVLYAYEHGAQVINMSFGGSACSIAVQDALEVAYSRCVLVASAGNDTFINEPAKMSMLDIVPNYPAALNYVIGVMSVGESGVESGFTNIDGKLYTKTEYEVYAPGEGILSTIPNDRYASWSGTSMAAPVVSAIAAILRSEYPDRNTYPTKFIYGQLTATSSNGAICANPTLHGDHNVPNIINLYEALTKLPTPDVGLYDYALFDTAGLPNDTAGKNNGDGVIDAGETIALGLTLRNRWGQASDTVVTIDTLSPAGIADPYIEIINPTVNYGTVGTYSTLDSGAIYEDDMLVAWENPFYIHIKEDCPNDYIFRLNVTITAENGLDEKDENTYTNTGSVELEVRSGTVLPSVIEQDMTLTPDSLWIIPNGTTILEGVTVNVEPGTHIQFWSNDPSDPYADQYIAGLDVKGRFLVNGTAEDMVYIYPSELMSHYNVAIYESENGYVSIKYADMTNMASHGYNYYTQYIISTVDNCIFRQNYSRIMYRYVNSGTIMESNTFYIPKIINAENTVFYKLNGLRLNGEYEKCIFADCDVRFNDNSIDAVRNSVFLGNNSDSETFVDGSSTTFEFGTDYVSTHFIQEYISHIAYSNETGSTYVYSKRLYQNHIKEFLHQYISALGGNYVSIETEAELYLINKNFYNSNSDSLHYYLELDYNEETEKYQWKSGADIKSFIDVDGVTFNKYNDNDIRFHYDGKKIKAENTIYHIPYIFEIPGHIYPEDIGLSAYSVNIGTDSTYQLAPSATPATDEFIYESSNTAVATVDENGVVTPVAPGSADITVYSFDKAVYNHVTVNVFENSEDVTLGTNESYTINPWFTDAENIKYEISDNTVVSLDENGTVTAVAPGTATIKVSDADSTRYYNINITVEKYKETKHLGINEVYQIVPQFTPAAADISYVIDDTAVATVDNNGLVTPVEAGVAEITVSDKNSGRYYTITVTVGMPVADIYTNETYQITQTMVPAETQLIHISEDEATATVDGNGLVTPVTAGSTTVFVYLADETPEDITDNQLLFTLTVNITQFYPLEGIDIVESERWMLVGDKGKINVSYIPSNASVKGKVTYSSSDENVLTVDAKGNVTAVGRGTATITATSSLGFTDTITVYVHVKTTSLSIDKDVLTASLNDGYMDLPAYTVADGTGIYPDWKSTDENVAVIENNRVKLIGEGTTSLILTDNWTGLSDSVLLYVIEGEVPVIEKIAGYDSESIYSLDSAGNLWKTPYSMSGSTAELYMQDVIDVDLHYSTPTVLGDDGSVYYNKSLVTELFKDKNPVKVEQGNNQFVLTEDGSLYSWGYDNSYGQLGLGHKNSVDNPTLVNIENVSDIAYSLRENILYLIVDGDLYATGSSDYQYMTPTFIRENVIGLSEFSDFVAPVFTDGYMLGLMFFECAFNYSGYDEYSLEGNGFGYAVRDGKLYKFYDGKVTEIDTPAQVVTVALNGTYYDQCLFSTVDGLLYCYDGTNFVPVETIHFDNDNLALVSSNISADNVLDGTALKLDFNKEIKAHNLALYADDVQIPATISTEYDVITVSRSAGFESGVTYRLEIPAGGLTGVGGATNSEAISVTFTSAGVQTASEIEDTEVTPQPVVAETSAQNSAEPAQITETVEKEVPVVTAPLKETTIDETVVNESQTDEELLNSRFYWTVDSLVEELTKVLEETQINPQFTGNVILNRITTDTDPANWMRVVAPSSSTYIEVPLGGNYWGTTNETLIGKQIVDYSDYNSYARLMWENYLTEAPEDVFPFITDVKIYDKNGEETRTVGAQEITVKVSFNRDMDATIPLRVTFGSSYPYADYTIDGEYTDPRTWQGTYTVSTLIEGGTNYFNFADGMSATDNLMFCEDTARFAFEIDVTAAQALIMQGYATDTGIQLSWTQDDFTTLMGYNVYRSTSEDGYYQKINPTVIPANTKEFFDDTVEPGTMYYYNFTVVQTDMKESVPSGKIAIMSKDTMAPAIYHTPVYTAFTGSNMIINATVTDNLNLSSVKAYYRTTGTEEWNIAVMSKLNDKYSAIIPADFLTLDGVEYYIEAFDGINYTYKGSADAPYSVVIQQAIDASSLGDVNGDGKISNYDALMLLQAINDKLNLTSEQFTRADLDGNGVLQAFEALRILQYVNGTVGSVTMP